MQFLDAATRCSSSNWNALRRCPRCGHHGGLQPFNYAERGLACPLVHCLVCVMKSPDVVIIGSGVGGGAIARQLAPSDGESLSSKEGLVSERKRRTRVQRRRSFNAGTVPRRRGKPKPADKSFPVNITSSTANQVLRHSDVSLPRKGFRGNQLPRWNFPFLALRLF